MMSDTAIARREIILANGLGLHLRPANRFAESAKAFQSDIRVRCKGTVADGKSVLSLLGLAAECGSVLGLEARGLDAEDAVDALARLVSARFHEA